MSSHLYILCPGQGAQIVGMGRSLRDAWPAAAKVFALADQTLGFSLSNLCFTGPQETLNKTDISQPALFATAVASFRAAEAAGALSAGEVTSFAGLSLGEFTALHLAGVFGFEDGLRLVAARGRFMQEAADASPGGMVAILGADEERVSRLCEEAAGGEVLVPANYNAPGQIVISGTRDACGRAVKVAEAAGLKAAPLPVAGAFHSPLMQPAADRMAAELERVEFRPPTVPVPANVTGRPHEGVDSIRKLLVRQIVSPVRWSQTMQAQAADESARFVELAPGRTLAGLAKRINRRLPIQSLDNAESLAAASPAGARGSES